MHGTILRLLLLIVLCSRPCAGEARLTGAWPGAGGRRKICRWTAYIQWGCTGVGRPARIAAPKLPPSLCPSVRRLRLLMWLWRESTHRCRWLDVVASNLFPINSFALGKLTGSQRTGLPLGRRKDETAQLHLLSGPVSVDKAFTYAQAIPSDISYFGAEHPRHTSYESKELQPSNLALETLDIAANSRVAVAKASTQRINSQRILADETLGKGIALTRSNLVLPSDTSHDLRAHSRSLEADHFLVDAEVASGRTNNSDHPDMSDDLVEDQNHSFVSNPSLGSTELLLDNESVDHDVIHGYFSDDNASDENRSLGDDETLRLTFNGTGGADNSSNDAAEKHDFLTDKSQNASFPHAFADEGLEENESSSIAFEELDLNASDKNASNETWPPVNMDDFNGIRNGSESFGNFSVNESSPDKFSNMSLVDMQNESQTFSVNVSLPVNVSEGVRQQDNESLLGQSKEGLEENESSSIAFEELDLNISDKNASFETVLQVNVSQGPSQQDNESSMEQSDEGLEENESSSIAFDDFELNVSGQNASNETIPPAELREVNETANDSESFGNFSSDESVPDKSDNVSSIDLQNETETFSANGSFPVNASQGPSQQDNESSMEQSDEGLEENESSSIAFDDFELNVSEKNASNETEVHWMFGDNLQGQNGSTNSSAVFVYGTLTLGLSISSDLGLSWSDLAKKQAVLALLLQAVSRSGGVEAEHVEIIRVDIVPLPRRLGRQLATQRIAVSADFGVLVPDATPGDTSSADDVAAAFAKGLATSQLSDLPWAEAFEAQEVALQTATVSNPRVVVSSSSTQNGDFLAPSTTSFSSSTSPEAQSTSTVIVDDNDTGGNLTGVSDVDPHSQTQSWLRFLPLAFAALGALSSGWALRSSISILSDPQRLLCEIPGLRRRHPWLLAKSKRASGHAPLLGRQSVLPWLPPVFQWTCKKPGLTSDPSSISSRWQVCQNGHLLVMQPLSHGKENGEATGLVASAWNQWGEADDSLRLRYAAPTRLILRRAPDPEANLRSDASPRDEYWELELDMKPVSLRLLQGLILLEAAAAAVVTIVSGAVALLLGIVVLVGFVASNLPTLRSCRLMVATLPWLLCSAALGSALLLPEASLGFAWLSPVGMATGIIGSCSIFSSHLFESDRFGFFLMHVVSSLMGIVCIPLVLLGMRAQRSEVQLVKAQWWDLPLLTDAEIVFAGQLAALCFLLAFCLHRLVLAISIHPFAQPLRAPHLAKTLLQRQQSGHELPGEVVLPKVPCFARNSAARSGVRHTALSQSAGHREQEPEEIEEIEEQAVDHVNSESSDGLCAGVLQVVLEADWPISHCLTPHRVRSGAPLIHWKLVPRRQEDQENCALRELASSSGNCGEEHVPQMELGRDASARGSQEDAPSRAELQAMK